MKERGTSIVALLAGAGFALVWRVGKALNNDDVRFLVGGCAVLAVVLTVGALFVAWSVSQSRLRRQELSQDDFDELRKMALLGQILGRGAPNITVKTPDQAQLSGPFVWPFPVQQGQSQSLMLADGEYRDSINLE